MLHKHRIVPGYMGGTYDPSNVVMLTTEQHAEAHRVLFEQYGNWQDEFAWKGLSGMIHRDKLIRNIQSLVNKGKPKSKETREKMRRAKLGKKQSLNHIVKRMTTMQNIYNSQEYKDKISKGNKGKKAQQVIIDGITYSSITEAMKLLHKRFSTIKKLMT